jgi:glycosyltransferase involved in cell wall biosynthesis
MPEPITVIQHWGGCPTMPNSKWEYFVRLAAACTARRWKTIMVWSAMPSHELADPVREAGCEIVLQPRPRRNIDAGAAWRTYRLARRSRCQIFHCYNVHTGPLVGAALAGVPVRIWSKLSMSRHYAEGRTPRGIARLQPSTRLTARLARRILCISHAAANELRAIGVPQSKLDVYPRPIDVQRFATGNRGFVRKALHLPADAPVITTVGHAVPVKGWDVLIQAFSQLAPSYPAARLLLVGSTDAPHERATATELGGLARRLRVADRVIFANRRTDIPDILADSDVFVLPSRSEGLPGALLEAMAAGVPCIGTRVGGTPEVIQDGRNGLLVDREDCAGLAHALRRLLEAPALRDELGRSARRDVARFDIRARIEALLGVYEELLSNSTDAVADRRSPRPLPALRPEIIQP